MCRDYLHSATSADTIILCEIAHGAEIGSLCAGRDDPADNQCPIDPVVEAGKEGMRQCSWIAGMAVAVVQLQLRDVAGHPGIEAE